MIRRVERGDEKYFVEVYMLAYKGLEEYAYTSRRDVKWYFRWLIKRDRKGFYTYVLKEPIGFVACDCNWMFEECEAEIHEIFVRPDHQGKGIGTALIKKALDYARYRGRSVVGLWVGIRNERAIRFYKRFGFVEKGCIGRWLRMVLHLSKS